MGDFYQVIKTIKGHKYLYKQRTFRKGGRVCTESHYLGPAGAGDVAWVQAEQSIRRGTPSQAQVAAAVKWLNDPRHATAAWDQPWASKGAVNTTFARNDRIDRHLAALGVVVVEHPNAEGAFYNHGRDAIVLPSGHRFQDRQACSSTEAYYFTLLHELAHWSGHASRLGRTIIGHAQIRTRDDFEVYAKEELVAELTAILVMSQFGIAASDKSQHATYFQNYLHNIRNKDEALEYAMNEAHRAAGYILASPQLTALKVAYGLL